MLERDIEAYLVKEVKKRGGLAYKFTSVNNRGVPDRVLVLPGKVVFVEVKTEKGVVSQCQKVQIGRIKALYEHCYVVYSKEDIDALMEVLNV